jgi:hypothetical protein
MHVDGICHCGFIAYEAEIDPADVSICHCTDCQIMTSSAFRIVAVTKKDSFRLLSGEPTIYVKTADSGRPRAQAFCPRCGTQMYATAAVDSPALYGLRVGAIRQRRQLRPTRQIWCRSAFDWIEDIGAIPHSDSVTLTANASSA